MIKITTVDTIEEFCNCLEIKISGLVPKDITSEFKDIDELCSIKRKNNDALAIACIASNTNGDILEIGTSHGISTYNLSVNAPKNKIIHTINITESEDSAPYEHITHKIKNNQIGKFYRCRNVNNVKQHYGDTLKWQAPTEVDQLGMVFIDGCHDRTAVLNDSNLGYFRLNNNGFMVWHDFNPALRHKYSWINSVMSGVEDFFHENNLQGEIIHLKNSLIGVFQKNNCSLYKQISKNINVGLVLDSTFHHKKRWVCALTPFLIEGIRTGFQTTLIQNQTEYEQKVHELDALISMEANWSSPAINYSRTPALRSKIESIPSFIYMSDPHSNLWRQDYFLESGLAKVLTPYYAPFRLHFNKIRKDRILHFPWALPDHWVYNTKLRHNGQKRICCFGGSKDEAYTLRNWCKSFDFVSASQNSGCENKSMTDEAYFRWLNTWDAAIAAGSDNIKYLLTTPKYFEIAASGALLFAQWTADLELLGFEHGINCIIFRRENFIEHCTNYLKNPEKYIPIRAAGLALVRSQHTVSKRITLLHDEILQWSRSKRNIAN